MEKKVTTYGELKCRKAELRNEMEDGDFSREATEEYRIVLRLIKQAEKWLLWTIVSLMLITAGCTASGGVGASVSAYYPKKWESPESRKQHIQPTLGMARNNLPMVGGDK